MASAKPSNREQDEEDVQIELVNRRLGKIDIRARIDERGRTAGTSMEGVTVRLYTIGFDIGLIAGLIIIGLIIIGLPIMGLVLMPIILMEGEPRSLLAVPAAVADC